MVADDTDEDTIAVEVARFRHRAVATLGSADIVLCAEENPPNSLLAVRSENAEFIDAMELATRGVPPFYDLAVREGFRVVHIR